MTASPVSDDWQVFEFYNDQASAEAVAGLLRASAVPVFVSGDQPIPGLVTGFRLMVPARMMHRARWVLAQVHGNEGCADESLDTSEDNTSIR